MYIENLVRSAIAPLTIVAVVAQNTVWKMNVASAGTLLSSPIQKKPSQPMNPLPDPYITPKPITQNKTVPIMKSQKFFIKMLEVFLRRVMPASTSAKPGCIQNTSIAPSNTQRVSRPFTVSTASSAPAGISTAREMTGKHRASVAKAILA